VVAKFNDERTPEKMAAFVNQASPMKRKGGKKSKAKKAKGKTKKLRRKN
jgi:hypothetical protein